LGNEVIHSKGKRGLMNASIGKQIKNLKSFLRYCMRQEYIPKDDLVGFKKPTDSSDAVYVNEKELELLMDFDLSDNPNLDVVRDLFIIGCETGLRFSDFSKLNVDHISDGLIRKPVRKTGKKVVIPISKRLQRVLDKNGMKIPDCPNSIYFNHRIKEVCKLAGMDSQFSRIIQRGNRKEEVSVPKYEAIASHTCRRSFCTNQFLKGMPALLIRKISGHATEKAFLQYIKIDEEKAAEEMAKRWMEFDAR
jgi:integrase